MRSDRPPVNSGSVEEAEVKQPKYFPHSVTNLGLSSVFISNNQISADTKLHPSGQVSPILTDIYEEIKLYTASS